MRLQNGFKMVILKGSKLHCSKYKVQSIRIRKCPKAVTEQFPSFLPTCKCSWTCAYGHLARDYHVLDPFVGVANGIWPEVCVSLQTWAVKKWTCSFPPTFPFRELEQRSVCDPPLAFQITVLILHQKQEDSWILEWSGGPESPATYPGPWEELYSLVCWFIGFFVTTT